MRRRTLAGYGHALLAVAGQCANHIPGSASIRATPELQRPALLARGSVRKSKHLQRTWRGQRITHRQVLVDYRLVSQVPAQAAISAGDQTHPKDIYSNLCIQA